MQTINVRFRFDLHVKKNMQNIPDSFFAEHVELCWQLQYWFKHILCSPYQSFTTKLIISDRCYGMKTTCVTVWHNTFIPLYNAK